MSIEEKVLANYQVDAEFRQTLKTIIDAVPDGAWLTLTQTPAQPAPTVAPAGGEVSVKRDDVNVLISHIKDEALGTASVQAVVYRLVKALNEQPATPQGQGEVLDTLLTDEEIDEAISVSDLWRRSPIEAIKMAIKAQDANTRRFLAAQPHVQSPTVAVKCPVCLMTGFHAPTCPRAGGAS